MQYESAQLAARDYVCAECGGPVECATGQQPGQYVAVCGHDKTHQGIKRLPTATQALARGELDEVTQTGTQREMEALAQRMPERFNLLPRADVETGEVLDKAATQLVVAFAESVGLNAYLGHVDLYYGKPRVSIDGYYYKAKTQNRDISVAALPAVTEDYEKYHVDKADFFSIARGWVKGEEVHEVGIGIVTMAELAEMSKKNPDHKRYPIAAKYPQRTAEHRAEWQLLRKLIPLEVIPSPPDPLP